VSSPLGRAGYGGWVVTRGSAVAGRARAAESHMSQPRAPIGRLFSAPVVKFKEIQS